MESPGVKIARIILKQRQRVYSAGINKTACYAQRIVCRAAKAINSATVRKFRRGEEFYDI